MSPGLALVVSLLVAPCRSDHGWNCYKETACFHISEDDVLLTFRLSAAFRIVADACSLWRGLVPHARVPDPWSFKPCCVPVLRLGMFLPLHLFPLPRPELCCPQPTIASMSLRAQLQARLGEAVAKVNVLRTVCREAGRLHLRYKKPKLGLRAARARRGSWHWRMCTLTATKTSSG